MDFAILCYSAELNGWYLLIPTWSAIITPFIEVVAIIERKHIIRMTESSNLQVLHIVVVFLTFAVTITLCKLISLYSRSARLESREVVLFQLTSTRTCARAFGKCDMSSGWEEYPPVCSCSNLVLCALNSACVVSPCLWTFTFDCLPLADRFLDRLLCFRRSSASW